VSFFTISDAETLVNSFLDTTLDKWDWTHEAHLVVAYHMVTHHAPHEDLAHMRAALKQYNVAIGKENTDTSGYHETLTRFWLDRIRAWCIHTRGSVSWDEDTLDALLYDRSLTNRNVWLEYYTEAVIMGTEARHQYVAPL
jgi:hypothetical protein